MGKNMIPQLYLSKEGDKVIMIIIKHKKLRKDY